MLIAFLLVARQDKLWSRRNEITIWSAIVISFRRNHNLSWRATNKNAEKIVSFFDWLAWLRANRDYDYNLERPYNCKETVERKDWNISSTS